MKKSTIVILVLLIIFLAILSGVIINILDDNRLKEAQINEIKKANELIESNNLKNQIVHEDVIEASQSNIKLSPNAYICFEKYYKTCGHTMIEKEKIEDSEVNKTEEYFKNAYSDWEIKDFNQNEVKLYKEIDGSCDKHYLISIQDENIAIFTIDDDGNTNLKEVTDIPIEYLTEEDVKLLEQGITANGDSELSKKLEDFE